jgi:hypothetical protein
MVEAYTLDAINFVSDNFFVDPRRVKAICEGLLALNHPLRWHADMRVDSFLRYDDKTLALMRKSGCTTMTFGIESGSNRTLEAIDKQITVEDIHKAHKRLQSFGFLANYHFMIGFPDETVEDLRETMELMWTIGRAPNTVIYTPSIFLPYPGTPLYQVCVERGFQPPQSLEEWASYDWELGCRLPWFTDAHKTYLDEVVHTAEGAFFRQADSLAATGKQLYFRLKFWGLRKGLPAITLDRSLVRFAKRLFRKTERYSP